MPIPAENRFPQEQQERRPSRATATTTAEHPWTGRFVRGFASEQRIRCDDGDGGGDGDSMIQNDAR